MQENWAGIFGHQFNKDILERILNSSKVPHALLFSGKQGIGKDFIALRFAQLLNKKIAPKELRHLIESGLANLSDPYVKFIYPLPRGKNETDDSTPFEKLSSDEINEIKEELSKKIANPYYHIKLEKANTIKISSIRDINRFLSMKFEATFYRFIIISDAHLMNEASQNALLKNLEEPPEKVVFILTTSFPDLLRETIRSRCWSIYFAPLSNSDLCNILIDYFNVKKELAEKVSIFSDGSIDMAIQLIEHDFKQLKSKTINFLRYALGKKFNSSYNEISEIINNTDNSNLKLFIHMIITWLNDLQKHKISGKRYFFSDYLETLEKFNSKFPKANIKDLVYQLDYINSLIDYNININLLAMNLIYNISTLTNDR